MGHTGEAKRIIEEEAEHVERQEKASAEGDTEKMVEETSQHAHEQVRHAVSIQNYEDILHVALQSRSIDDLLSELLQKLRAMLQVAGANAYLVEPGGNVLHLAASAGLEEAVSQTVKMPLGSGFAGRVAAERRALELYEVDAEHVVNPLLVERGIRAMAGVPIVADEQLVGVLEMACTRREAFAEDEMRLLDLVARRTGVAIERVRLLGRLKEERERAEQNSQMKTTLMHMLSHDIKTPLAAIFSLVQMLEQGLVAPEQQPEFLRRVRHGLARLDLLISDLLDLARLEAQRPKLDTRVVPLQPIVQEVIELFSAQAAGAGVRVTSSVPDMEAKLNPRRLRQVLANLVSNAIKHSGSGSEAVVEAEHLENSFILRVRDNGRGIDPDHIPAVGTEFSERVDGTGLGLYLSRLLVQEQGGELQLYSKGKGDGLTVEVKLPA